MQKSLIRLPIKIVRFYCPSKTRSILDENIAQLPGMPSCDWRIVCLHDKPVISDPRSWYVQLHAEIRWPVNFKTKCTTSKLLIICRVTNGEPIRSAFYVVSQPKKIKQHKSVGVLIVCHFFVVTVVTWQVTCVMVQRFHRPILWGN